MPTAGDLKKLTPLVLLQALEEGGSAVCEPVFRVTAAVSAADERDLWREPVFWS